MDERTPIPWEIYSDVDPHHIKIKGIRPDIGGAHVADVLFPANAAFICKAVNSHDQLVDALESFVGMFGAQQIPGTIGDEVLQKANAALASVTEST